VHSSTSSSSPLQPSATSMSLSLRGPSYTPIPAPGNQQHSTIVGRPYTLPAFEPRRSSRWALLCEGRCSWWSWQRSCWRAKRERVIAHAPLDCGMRLSGDMYCQCYLWSWAMLSTGCGNLSFLDSSCRFNLGIRWKLWILRGFPRTSVCLIGVRAES